MRRQRIAVSPAISIHSKVARPSGPAKLQVTSHTPGAPSTPFTRSDVGQGAAGSTRRRSQAGWKCFLTTFWNVARSAFESRAQSPSNAGVISNFKRTDSGSQRVVEVLEKRVGAIDDSHAAGGHMRIDFALHRLPTFCPEPALIRRHGQDRAQLDPAVFLLDDLELGSRLVQMKPLAKVNREGHGSTRLKRYEVRLHAKQHSSNTAFFKSRCCGTLAS